MLAITRIAGIGIKAIVLAALAGGSVARADWAYTRWGMAVEEVLNASKGNAQLLAEADRDKEPLIYLQTLAEGDYDEDGLALGVTFAFDTRTGGLRCVFYYVRDASKNPALRDLMVDRYGQPRLSDDAETGVKSMTWDQPDHIDLQWVEEKPAYVAHCQSLVAE